MEVLSSLFLLEKHDIPKGVSIPPFDVLKKATVFSKYELKRIFARFCTLCIENGVTNGIVDKPTFLLQPEVSFCFLVDMAFDFEASRHVLLPVNKQIVVPNAPPANDADPTKSTNIVTTSVIENSNGLDFEQFVSFFNEFSPLRSLQQKLDCKYYNYINM